MVHTVISLWAILHEYSIGLQYMTVTGILRKNKLQIPNEMNMRPEGTSMFDYQEKCTLLLYVVRKNENVFLLAQKRRHS